MIKAKWPELINNGRYEAIFKQVVNFNATTSDEQADNILKAIDGWTIILEPATINENLNNKLVVNSQTKLVLKSLLTMGRNIKTPYGYVTGVTLTQPEPPLQPVGQQPIQNAQKPIRKPPKMTPKKPIVETVKPTSKSELKKLSKEELIELLPKKEERNQLRNQSKNQVLINHTRYQNLLPNHKRCRGIYLRETQKQGDSSRDGSQNP